MKYDAKASQRITLDLEFEEPIQFQITEDFKDKFQEEVEDILNSLLEDSVSFDELMIYDADLYEDGFELSGKVKLRGSVEKFNYSDSPTEYEDNFEEVSFTRSDFAKKYEANSLLSDYKLHSIYLSISEIDDVEYD